MNYSDKVFDLLESKNHYFVLIYSLLLNFFRKNKKGMKSKIPKKGIPGETKESHIFDNKKVTFQSFS